MRKLLKTLIVCFILGCLLLAALYSLSGKPFVKVMFISIFGDRQLENTLSQFKVKFIPSLALRFKSEQEDNIVPTWAFRPSHAVPTYPIPVVADADKDGKPEVYIGSYSKELNVLDGKTGVYLWKWLLPFGVVGGRVVDIVDLDNDGTEEVVLGSHTSLPIRIYALKSGPTEQERVLWYRNVSGDFLEGGLNIVKDKSMKSPLIIAATRDAPYSRGSFNVIKSDGTMLYKPVSGLDDCISRPAIGYLPNSSSIMVIHGSHDFYKAKYAHRIVARDLKTGVIKWMSPKIGDTGYQNHQIVDVDFDGNNEVLSFASDNQKKEHKFILSGSTGSVIREVPWFIQGILKKEKRLIVAEGDSTICLNSHGKPMYKIPKISFGIEGDSGEGMLLISIKYLKETLTYNVYRASDGKMTKKYACKFKLPPYTKTLDYGVFGVPSREASFLTLADTDNDKSWDTLIQIRDFVVNIKLPIKVHKGQGPYAPLPFRNIDNSGILVH